MPTTKHLNLEARELLVDYVTEQLDPHLRQPGDDRSSGRDLLLDAHPDELIIALHAAGLLLPGRAQP